MRNHRHKRKRASQGRARESLYGRAACGTNNRSTRMITNPPDRGVEIKKRVKMDEVIYQIHWIGFTVKADSESAMSLYQNIFQDTFGKVQPLGNGGRGFKEIYVGLLGIKIYLTPISSSSEPYWCIEIPGLACEQLTPDHLFGLFTYLEGNFKGRYKFTRLDFAFDHVGFTPEDVEAAVRNNLVRSLAKRESLHIESTPFLPRDDGELGTYTVEFGSNQSERMITVYNKRGYTRLEFQMRDARADLVAKELFSSFEEKEWFKIAIAHLRDFADFETDWWEKFVTANARAFQTISRARDVSMGKIMRWMVKQVSPALSVVMDTLTPEEIKSLINQGRKRRGPRYDSLLPKPVDAGDGAA